MSNKDQEDEKKVSVELEDDDLKDGHDCSSRCKSLKRKHPSTQLVSVIMPVHNAEKYLEEAFESVCNQTYRPLEIVCFDDCSTDKSWSVIQSWQEKFDEADITTTFLKSHRDDPSGPGYGRIQAIQNSREIIYAI